MAYFIKWLRLVVLHLLILLPSFLYAQYNYNDSFQLAITANNIANPQQVLFVQTDKTVYAAGETIWFAGYLLQDVSPGSLTTDVLLVALVNTQSKKIILQKNYLLEGGLCTGSLLLPDTLEAGNYSLVAYTNLLNQTSTPLGRFMQPLTIKTKGKTTAKPINVSQVTQGKNIDDSLIIGFYPEGGDLVQGLPCRVAWEAKNRYGLPVKVIAVLLEDGVVLDTLRPTKAGMGSFMLIPKQQKRYSLKVIGALNAPANNTYALPAALADGVVLNIDNNLADDSLHIKLETNGQKMVRIAISNRFSGTVSNPVNISGERELVIPLHNIDKGINTVTVVNNDGRAEAECVFFAHYNKRNQALINPDKAGYNNREKVHVSIDISDENKAALGGVFTIACVQHNRQAVENQQDIASYFYTQGLADDLANNILAQTYNDTATFKYALLVKGWRRYTWRSLMENKYTANAASLRKIEFTGQLTKNNRPFKKAKQLVVMRDSAFSLINTNDAGIAHLIPAKAVVPETRQAFLNVPDDENKLQVVFTDSVSQLVNTLVKSLNFPAMQQPVNNIDTIEASDIPSENVLPVVVVKSKTMPLAIYSTPILNHTGPNACGDYVCAAGILNCSRRDGPLSSPIEGEAYYNASGDLINYKGCVIRPSFFKVNNIYTAREFYAVDSSAIQAANALPMSTILWKPLLTVDKTGGVNLDFWTSDVKGVFTITVQGICANGDMLFAEKTFKVGR